MNGLNIGIKMEGEYRIQVFSDGCAPDKKGKNGRAKIDTGFFKNILTDSFFDAWVGGTSAAPDTLVDFCGVGSGTATPTAADTSITQVGTRVSLFSRTTANSGYVNTTTMQFRFAASQIIGTITEVGLFAAATLGSCSSRALIKDLAGTPTSITLIAGDTLYITWRCTATASSSDITGTISISGTNYDYVMRVCNFAYQAGVSNQTNVFMPMSTSANLTASNGLGLGFMLAFATQTLGAYTGAPAGTAFASSLASIASYTTGSLARTLTYTLLPAQGNTGSGIGSFMVTASNSSAIAGFQVSLAATSGGATLPKDATKTFTLPITYTFSR